MRKIIALIFVTVFILSSFSVYAVNDFEFSVKINYDNETVTLSGKSGKANDRILVIDKNFDNSLQHERVFNANEDGNFSYKYEINSDSEAALGKHIVFLTSKNGTQKQDQYYYLKENLLATDLSSFLKGNASELEIYLSSDKYISIFSLQETKLFLKTDKKQLAQRCSGIFNEIAVDSEIQKTVDTVRKIIIEQTLLEAYKNSDRETIFNNGFNYSDILQLENIDSAHKVSAFSIYTSLMSSEGQQLVRNGLDGKSFDLLSDWHEKFIEKTLLISLVNANKNGYGHVLQILNTDNLSFLGIALKRNLTDSDAMLIASHTGGFSDKDDLKNFLDSLPDSSNRPQEGGSSGGGGYTNPGKTFPPIVKAPDDKSDNEEDLFVDLDETLWAKEAILELKKKNIISGADSTHFLPNNFIKREEVAKMICLVAGVTPINEDSGFSDVLPDSWYAPYISALKKYEIINGKSEYAFGVGEPVTRQELCTMIYRFMKDGISENSTPVTFVDKDSIADYSMAAVRALTGAKILNGYSDGSFLPDKNCTRAEAAVIIYNSVSKGKVK